MRQEKMRFLNRDVIKYAAMVTMLLNHYAHLFLTPGTWMYEVFVDIGYFTGISMCWFLVEGYEYTRSRRAYARRLLIFAAVSQIPFWLAFSQIGVGWNMIFTLFLCFCIISVMKERPEQKGKGLILALLVCVSAFGDWGILAPVFTIFFVQARGSREKEKKAWLFSVLLFGFFCFLEKAGHAGIAECLRYSLCCMTGPALAGICILHFYNGKKMKKGSRFSKWFFYLFYPGHLLVLWILKFLQ